MTDGTNEVAAQALQILKENSMLGVMDLIRHGAQPGPCLKD